jgi:hypothetical protein
MAPTKLGGDRCEHGVLAEGVIGGEIPCPLHVHQEAVLAGVIAFPDNTLGRTLRRRRWMATHTLTIEIPEELLDLLGTPAEAAIKAREALVVEFLREGRLSQGQAARVLGVTRWDILDLMARFSIPSGPETAEEMRRDVENAKRAAG